jgi:hypothetical protein
VAAILLVFLGVILQVARFVVDRREKSITSAIQALKESEQANREAGFQEKISGLEVHLGERQKEIAELKSESTELRSQTTALSSKAEGLDPLRQTIKTASATVEVIIASSEAKNDHYMDSGGYLAFGKGEEALMILNSMDCFAFQQGLERVLYRGVFNLDATSPIVGKSIGILKGAEYLQIGFKPMPPKQRILGGRAVVTVNSTVRLEFDVPPQEMSSDFVLVRPIASGLATLK